MRLFRRPNTRQTVLVNMPIYIRGQGTTLRLEVAATATARSVTATALTALDDDSDFRRYRLRYAGRVVRPGRSLQANGIGPGATLDLIRDKKRLEW